jgi:hypothetical protein
MSDDDAQDAEDSVPVKSFREAREEITGESWLDNLARASLFKAEVKFAAGE